MIRQPGEKRLHRVQHHPLRPDRIDGVSEPDEKPLEIILARFLDLASLDVDVIEHDFFLSHKLVEVEAERAHIVRELLGIFLEHHEHPRLAKLRRAAHQEFDGEHRLPAPGAAADECGPTGGQPAAGDFIKAGDAGGGFEEGG